MQMKKVIILTAFLGGCSAHQVVDRSDDLFHRPGWASLDQASFDQNNNRHYVAFIEVDGSSSKSAALNMADEKALSEPFRALVSEFLDQNQIGEELRKDEQFSRRIISATRGYRPAMPTLKISHRYWEQVVDAAGKNELRAFSLAEMSIADFEQAKENVLAKLRGDPEVKKILDEVGAKQREAVGAKAISQKAGNEKN